jgi:hypothetical protein
MNATRRRFLGFVALFALPIGGAAAGCGGDDDDPAEGGSGGGSGGGGGGGGQVGDGGTCADVTTTIENNHPTGPHILDVPLSDVLAGEEKTYDIQGESSHTHTVTITAAEFATIAGGGTVTTKSSVTGHSHPVEVGCSSL